ncbi:putative ATP-dependent RNA helicase [Pseudolycoriella hygida]|uniref:ATP-dependent RNA helicase n=1 Tax=Pseudolycoriella hygida TaxID=35572 RepID=A0A9Q0MW33_9DIPT|nr:putative ATP-dependent RNA helicase [Pseudolycoriella hygida]
MDISLNISKPAQPIVRKVEPPTFAKKKAKTQNDFSFKFTKGSKVKAIVAKKRSPGLLVKKQQMKLTTVETIDEKPNADIFQNDETNEEDEPPIQLSLNVTQGNESDRMKTAEKIIRKKLTKKQRKELILEKKSVEFRQEFDNPIKSVEPTKPKKQFKDKAKKMSSLFANNADIPIVGQRLVHPVSEKVFTGEAMSSIGLHEHAVKNLADILHITELTTVQKRTVPVALSGRDVLVRSQTGSGKTLAYALPIVQKLQEIRPKLSRKDGILAVIIVPTRELAIQSYELLVKLLKPYQWVVSTYISGGEKRKTEKARLRKGVNVLVGTPGRLCDHLLHTESFKLDKVKWLVLDEADRLFELGYEKDVKKIVDALNTEKVEEGNPFAKKRESSIQTLLLSATLTHSVRQLAGLALKNPFYIDTSDVTNEDILKSNAFNDSFDEAITDDKLVLPSTVSQSYVLVPPKLRLVTLSGLIASESVKPSKILVFLATEQLVEFHHDLMIEALTKRILDVDDDEEQPDEDSDDDGEEPILGGVRFFKLHGSLTQVERSAVFKAFRDAKSGVLLTTDVAARGIDIPMVDLVVQFFPPQRIQDYVHRVGRTGRAGKTGRAILFLSPVETDFVRLLEDKRIRIAQEDSTKYLKGIVQTNGISSTMEESASELQRKFEGIIQDDTEMHDRACKVHIL